jgi:hypothetical protein
MKFLNLLDIIEIGESAGRSIYRLNKALIYESAFRGQIVIPKGFETDFASVPRVPIIYMMWGDRAHREAVLHDYLYRIDADPRLNRTECDGMFREAMISRGQPFYIYNPMWAGVRIGGAPSYHKKYVEDKLCEKLFHSS